MRFGPDAAKEFSVILARPQSPENIGLVARAMKNTGFEDLRLVLDGPLPSTARLTAVHAEDILGGARLSLHLHDATGWALANLMAALQLGVETFDVTLGGLGGCPFLPGAPGNLAVHRVVRFLDAMGITTGVDLDRLQGGLHSLERMVSAARDRGSGVR